MTQTFRIRLTSGVSDRVRTDQVRTADYPGPLAELGRFLPAGSYVLSVENLAEGRCIHWTRWPDSIRPGMKDEVTGR